MRLHNISQPSTNELMGLWPGSTTMTIRSSESTVSYDRPADREGLPSTRIEKVAMFLEAFGSVSRAGLGCETSIDDHHLLFQCIGLLLYEA